METDNKINIKQRVVFAFIFILHNLFMLLLILTIMTCVDDSELLDLKEACLSRLQFQDFSVFFEKNVRDILENVTISFSTSSSFSSNIVSC